MWAVTIRQYNFTIYRKYLNLNNCSKFALWLIMPFYCKLVNCVNAGHSKERKYLRKFGQGINILVIHPLRKTVYLLARVCALGTGYARRKESVSMLVDCHEMS